MRARRSPLFRPAPRDGKGQGSHRQLRRSQEGPIFGGRRSRGNSGDEKELRIRPLLVDDKVKEWTTGEAHDVTDRSVAVRRALKVNDALPTDKAEHWVWQRGPWLLIDRATGHVLPLKLPNFDPSVSNVTWFRDYAAYCGLSAGGKQLYAVVAQVAGRKPLLMKKISGWNLTDHPTPACAPATWQREPLQITFAPNKAGPR